MSNNYFDFSQSANRFVANTVARAEDINARLDEISNGFTAVQADEIRSLKLPVGTTHDQVINSTSAQRQNALLAFDASGNVSLVGADITYRIGKVMGWDVNGNVMLYDYANSITAPSSAAVASATSAANSASTATAQAGIATTQATNSANSATSSANSATSSATSATNSANSATSAANSATIATTQAGIATTEAGVATTQATNSANSATASANSATSSAASATSAASSATTATTQSTNAATSATNAANSATSASTSATNSANSATLSQNWATQETGEVVVGQGYSAKYWAGQAASVVTGGVIDDTSPSTIKTYSSSKITALLPTKTSQLTNDSGFITTADLSAITALVYAGL